jgi:hypothetical protein
MAAVSEGDRVLIVERRLFKDDNTRIFVGIVEEFHESNLRARGIAFHVSPYEVAGSERPSEERVRLFTLGSSDVVFLLPRELDISGLQLRRSPKAMSLTDGKYAMDLSDFLLRA